MIFESIHNIINELEIICLKRLLLCLKDYQQALDDDNNMDNDSTVTNEDHILELKTATITLVF